MHLLEGRFRRQFVRDGDGYLFRIWYQDIPFTQAEVDDFIAQRRRVWSNPCLWAAFLFGGIALPAALFLHGHDAGGWTLGIFALLFMLVLMIHVDRKPIEAAQARAVVPERRGLSARQRISQAICMMGLSLVWVLDGKAWLFVRALWALLFLRYAYDLGIQLHQRWRKRHAGAA